MRARAVCGFTLVEVAVVVVLLAVVAVAAAPGLRGGDGTARDRAAQSSIDSVFDAEVGLRRDLGRFVTADDGAELAAANPEVAVAGPDVASAGPDSVSVAVAGTVVGAAALGGSACWLARRDFAAPAGTPAALHAFADTGPCTGTAALALAADDDPAAGGSWLDPLER